MFRSVISHRGNLSGPHSCLENSPAAIEHAIAQGFSVEVDLRVTQNPSALWLGHDGPEHEVSEFWMLKWADRLWIHAKNVQALQFCVERRLRCFSHDKDDCVLASTMDLWRYPRSDIPVTKDTIIVIPEICQVTEQQWLACKGFCTDYCWAYETETFQLHELVMAQQLIYNEMLGRNSAQRTDFEHDPQLLEQVDGRRCLALYSMFSEGSCSMSEQFFALQRRLKQRFPQQCCYIDGPASAGQFCFGQLHITTMQLLSFPAFQRVGEPHANVLSRFESVIKEQVTACGVAEFEVSFRHLIVVRTGVLIAGYASTDLNALREALRKAFSAAGLEFEEPYKCDIVHATVLRFANPLTVEERLELQDLFSTFRNSRLGTVKVRAFHLGTASWRMQDEELKISRAIKLC